MENGDLFELARNVGTQLVSLLTLLICLVITLVRWKRHPKVSLITALGLVLLIVHSLVFAVADVWLERLMMNAGIQPDHFFLILGLSRSLTLAVAFAVLLTGILSDRSPRAITI
jgi:hypothetical protein